EILLLLLVSSPLITHTPPTNAGQIPLSTNHDISNNAGLRTSELRDGRSSLSLWQRWLRHPSGSFYRSAKMATGFELGKSCQHNDFWRMAADLSRITNVV
ncbi:MAG: hypothetical protein AB7L90_26285, partial [Hyphomicrobiaceae bacterium]